MDTKSQGFHFPHSPASDVIHKEMNLNDVLRIEVVRDHLFSFLNLGDLKALSETCWESFGFVRNSNVFLNNVKFIVCSDSVSCGAALSQFTNWRHIVLDLSIPIETIIFLHTLLKTVNVLDLRYPKIKEDLDLDTYFYELFKDLENLSTLKIDYLLFENNLVKVLESTNVKSVLSKLDCLIFWFPSYTNGIHSSQDLHFGLNNFYYWKDNFKALGATNLQLKHLAVGGLVFQEPPFEDRVEVSLFVANTIKYSVKKLEVLLLNLLVVDIEFINHVRLDKLKYLDLTFNEIYKPVKDYVDSQPPVEFLSLRSFNELSREILTWLSTKTCNLKRLYLSFFGVHKDCSLDDWNFLSQAASLKDFGFKPCYGQRECIISKLPPSTTSVVQVDNFGSISGADFVNLKWLTRLWLLGEFKCINDDVLDGILKNCSNLLELHLSNCTELTDKSLDTHWGSYKDESFKLKGLRQLSLLGCKHITRFGVLNIMGFKYLEYFAFQGDNTFDDASTLLIAKQNPSLEMLLLPFEPYFNTENLMMLKNSVHQMNRRTTLKLITKNQSSFKDYKVPVVQFSPKTFAVIGCDNWF